MDGRKTMSELECSRGAALADAATNRLVALKRRPHGPLQPDDFALINQPVGRPGPGQILVQTIWLSLDPYLQLRARGHSRYYPAVPLNEAMLGGAVSRIVESRHPKFKTGDIVEDYTGWQDYALADGNVARKIDPAMAPISTALGVLGMPGLTAYLSLIDVGKPEPGDCVVVGSAAGAVGSVVGQVAKIAGCRVVGIVGSAAKASYVVEELGFDAAINRRSEDVAAALDCHCPTGINLYFENLGGSVSEAAYERLAHRARVVVCGSITEYSIDHPTMRSNLQNLLFSEARVGGFNIFSYQGRFEDARTRLARWYREGRLKTREEVVEGLENAAAALPRLFDGSNFGKLLVKVSTE